MSDERWLIVTAPDGAARTLAHYAADAFIHFLGAQQCKVFDCNRYQTGYAQLLKNPDPTMVTDLLNQSLVVSCLDFKASYCFVTALSPVSLYTLGLLKSCGVKTIHWFFEDFRRARYWNDVLDGYDFFFAIQHGEIETTVTARNSKYCFLPVATGCGRLAFTDAGRRYDVVFIGLPSPYRIEVLETLAHADISLAIAGSGWGTYRGILQPFIVQPTWIDDEAAFRLMQQSKVGLNLSFDNPAGRADVHIGPRAFDVLAAGCLLLGENNPLLDECLTDCVYHTFSSVGDVVAATTALLAGFSDSCAERTANRAMVLDKHQYRQRVRDILEKVTPFRYCSSKNSKG